MLAVTLGQDLMKKSHEFGSREHTPDPVLIKCPSVMHPWYLSAGEGRFRWVGLRGGGRAGGGKPGRFRLLAYGRLAACVWLRFPCCELGLPPSPPAASLAELRALILGGSSMSMAWAACRVGWAREDALCLGAPVALVGYVWTLARFGSSVEHQDTSSPFLRSRK